MNKREEIVRVIISGLEKGCVPWKKTWIDAAPQNPITGTHYKGINWMLTGVQTLIKEYRKPYWVTFLQTKNQGGHVKKGETGTPIVFYGHAEKENEEGEIESFPVLKTYVVFNVDQTEGIELPEKEVTKHETAEELLERIPNKPKVIAGNPAYHPSSNTISMPTPGMFDSIEEYYAAYFHELSHWGHRAIDGSVAGEGKYSFGELVAEIGACLLMGHVGLEIKFDNSQAYIKGWLGALKAEPGIIFDAVRMANRVVDFIVSKEGEKCI